MELSYPPFETICPSGNACGISVDIAFALGEYLHLPVEIKNIAFIGLIPSLKSGKIDLILSSMSITPERKESIAFSIPYAKIGLSLLISAKSDLQSIQEANRPDRVFVVKSGTSGEVYAREHLNLATVRVLDKESLCVVEVVQGKADAFIYDQLSVYANWQRNLKTTRANLTPLSIENWAIGIDKDNAELLNQINGFINDFKAHGGFKQLQEKYLFKEKNAFEKLGIPFIF
jgi:polar amino acid transport system substrate-binding protein